MATLSTFVNTEELIKTDKNTITRYKVVEEKIDIGLLEIEKKGIEEQLAKVLSDEQLLEWSRANYPYQDIDSPKLEERLKVINELLEVK